MDFDSDQESITPHQKQYVKIETTGALWLPAGTTAQRPSSPSAGFFRYNSDTPGLEYWNGTAWTAVAGGGGSSNSLSAVASETLTAGQYVNLWNNAGTTSARRADSSLGYKADGYITSSYASTATAIVFTEGNNTGLSGLTPGDIWLSTAGAASSTMPTSPALVQRLGVALSSSAAVFLPSEPVQTGGNAVTTTGDVTGLTANNSSTATLNTSLFQIALNAGGNVQITVPGTYYINGVLKIPSNTNLVIGAGVTIKLVDNANCGMFINKNAYSAGTLLTNLSGWAVGPPYYATIAQTGIGLLFAKDSYIGILDTSNTTTNASTQRSYIGVAKVLTSSANQITYELQDFTPGNGSGSVGGVGSSIYAFPVDVNISITGAGTIDGSGLTQTTHAAFYQGDPRLCLTWFRNAKNVKLEGFYIAAGITWSLGSNNVDTYTIKGIRGDTRGAGLITGDFIHLSGAHNHVLIDGVCGSCNDNMVGMTIDITNGTGYDFPYQNPGDMYDVTIKNVMGVCQGDVTPFAIVALYGPAAYQYHNITIDNISGQGSSAVQIATYSTTAMNNTTGDNISIRNLHTVNTSDSGPAVTFIGAYTFENVSIEDVNSPSTLSEAVKIGGTGTIRQLNIKNVYSNDNPPNGATSRTGPLVSFGAATLTYVNVSHIEGQSLGANNPLIVNSGATITKLAISNVSATGTGTSAIWSNASGTVAQGPVYYATTYNNGGLLDYTMAMGFDIAITGTATATLNRMHRCTPAADHTLTLPAGANEGDMIGVRITPGSTKLVTLSYSGNIDGQTTRIMWAGEAAYLRWDSTSSTWSKVAGKTIPMRACLGINTSTSLTVASGSITYVPFNVSVIDNTGMMNNLSSNTITVKRPGDYNVSFVGGFTNIATSALTRLVVLLNKNGTAIGQSESGGPGAIGSNAAFAASGPETLAVSDAMALTIFQQNPSAVSQTISTSAATGVATNLSLVELPNW